MAKESEKSTITCTSKPQKDLKQKDDCFHAMMNNKTSGKETRDFDSALWRFLIDKLEQKNQKTVIQMYLQTSERSET